MKRYAFLDVIRSVAIINMIIYHAIWDLVCIFGVRLQWYSSNTGYIWQQCICWNFILLSGFCSVMGKRRLKRGVTVFICGLLVSVITLVAMPENRIIFGILTLLGSCMLIACFAENGLKRINPWVGVFVLFALFVLTKNIGNGFFGVGNIGIEMPEALYSNLFSAYIGFPPAEFYSTDYFPIIPWACLFFTGYYLNKLFCRYSLMKYLDTRHIKVFGLISRNSLIIYMLHQPVIYLILKGLSF